ncbi:disease resistance TIR-NBS-LRR class family protein [Tanacetum coccineum]|uniref:Disease resistance TIR-NBS-LRR class family protein n=1 Tax=Tanacetum coccineum TaxID=301880 RepID=A0ABQ5GY58_9ASTR
MKGSILLGLELSSLTGSNVLQQEITSIRSFIRNSRSVHCNISIQKRFRYDVFISFRGEDTRNTFVGHLYEALKQKGIETFKDDERMKQGKTIDNQLNQAIKDSRLFIIVFSKNYASSSWCLDELVEIMDCGEHTAYPVFFDVEPTEIRKQSGAVKEAFAEHEKKEAAGKWREAMKEASNLAGWELKATANGHEAKLIKKVVQEISQELRSINFGFNEKLVGMETRVKDVVSSLEVGIDEVRMIGIKGMGGAGKTTTARAVFDHLSNDDFEAKSFVENIREVSNGSESSLKKLQEQVLSDVLNEHVTVNGVFDGKNTMKERMHGKKVLIVLDDVDHIKQLEALAGDPNWFKSGSRILITTRDEQVLVAHRANLICDIDLLSDKEAICLFSRYAFGRESPLQGYEELSRKVVRYAVGLPLTVKVLGSFLCGKDKLEWVDAIDRLKRIPLKETLEKLELSYISLEDDYKEIFLDIACILKGKYKEHAIKILEKEMGKNIVRRSHPDEPNNHSHLWIDKEIEDILANDMGSQATRCLKLKTSRGNSRILMRGLGKMKKLRYLEVMIQIIILQVILNQTILLVFIWNGAIEWKKRKQNRMEQLRDFTFPMTTSVGNNSVFRSFFEKQKLTGPNFIDWYRQLSYIDQLERLGHPVTLNLGVSLILVRLSKEYDSFVQNYNMHSMGKTVNELHAMLKLHEEMLPKKVVAPALHAIRARKVQKNKNKKPSKAAKGVHGKGKGKMAYANAAPSYAPKPKNPPPPKKDNPAKTRSATTAVK